MTITLSTLFCQPNDVYDLLSTEGVDLRQDDHNLATGYLITVSADTAEGSTTLPVSTTPVALLRGAVLVFDGGGMSSPVSVTLTSAAAAGSNSLTVSAISSSINQSAIARDSGLNVATAARLLLACRKGTSKIKLYCNSRYDDSQLVLSGTVLDWTALYAARFLCTRRAQGCPKSIEKDWEEAKEELRMVQIGQLSIEDIGTRGADWPTVTNVIVNPSYNGMRVRVQENVSEQSPTDYPRFIDWNSYTLLGY